MQLTKEVVRKRIKLGKIGELEAKLLLSSAGFRKIIDLNEVKKNHKFADFLAERDDKLYVISVKARNMWEKTSRQRPEPHLNERYKLAENTKLALENALEAATHYKAIPAWLVLQVEEQSYNAYFGTITQLKELGLDGGGVNMKPEYTSKYECLAKRQMHNYEFTSFYNEAPKG